MYSGTAARVIDYLQGYNLKEEGKGKYRSNSPLRPGSNSQAFTLTLDDDEHGAYFDHVTQDAGSLYDLAKHLGIELPPVIPVANTKRAYAGIDDYAKAHGITGDILSEAQWREVTYKGRPALEYPTRTGNRWRFLDGKMPHYSSPLNYQRCWYGLNKYVLEAISRGLPVIIANGEISVISAQHHQVPAIAMTGGEKGEIPDDLLTILKTSIPLDTPILIAMDCDKTGRTAARGIESQLKAQGYEARAVDLGLSAHGDLADFCALHTQESLTSLVDLPSLPVTVEYQKWQFASIDDLLRLPPIEWLVPKQIPSRGLTMLFGASGSYKSFFILDISMNLALADTNVVYIVAEGEHGYRQRVEAWIAHHKTKPQHITFVLGQVDLFNTDDLTEFSQIVETYKPKMIVVDTLAMCSGAADENSSRDMSIIVQGCKAMSRTLDAVIVIVHHTNQEGKKERGAKNLRNSCDTIIRVTKEDEDLILVQSQKTKDTTPFADYRLSPVVIPLGYKNNIGEEVSSVVLLPAEKVVRSQDLTHNQRLVLEALATQPKATLTEIADATEIDHKGSISRTITQLAKRGYIHITTDAREITPEGQAQLDKLELQGLQGVAGVAGVAPDSSDSENAELRDMGATGATLQPLLTIGDEVPSYFEAGL